MIYRVVVFQVASWGLMLSASSADMKAYWCNEVFAKVYSLYCGLHLHMVSCNLCHCFLVRGICLSFQAFVTVLVWSP